MFIIKNLCIKINNVVIIICIIGVNNVISYMFFLKFMYVLEIFIFKLFIVLINDRNNSY